MTDFSRIILEVYRGQSLSGVLYQPRLETWYAVNKTRGTIPGHLAKLTLPEIYDYVHGSVRHFGAALCCRYDGSVEKTETWESDSDLRRSWHTPEGTLTEFIRYDAWHVSGYHIEYKIKTERDLDPLEYLFRHEEWYWDAEIFEKETAAIGSRGEPQFCYRRAPLQGLMIEHAGYENTVFLMHDYPDRLRRYLAAGSAADDQLYDVLCASPLKILSLGENLDANLDPPPIFTEYLVPYYNKRIEQIHKSGKYVHVHADGSLGPLLPHLRDCPWDGVEGATPFPQGDVTLDQLKESLQDVILLDGIPAIFFLKRYPIETLIECAKKVVELFHPNLILGISDELPPEGDIERVKLIGELVKEGNFAWSPPGP